MARFEVYSNKATLTTSDLLVIADSEDLDADGHYKTKKIKASLVSGGGGGTDTKADQVIGGAAGSFKYNTTPAPLDTDTGTNGRIKRQRFDDTTEEFIIGYDKVCSDLNLTGSATIIFDGYAVTATPTTTSKIELTVRVSSKAAGESWDAAFTTTVSADFTLKTTQDLMNQLSFTVVASTLGVAANDDVRIKWSRTAPSANNLSGDYGATYAAVKLPRS